jgi:MFS family permease
MLNLMVDPIKRSLVISDTQFSLIQGSAFVFSYTLMAPVFGRLVDLTNRRNILAISICLWSLFTSLCSYASTFEQLFLARCGVGMSEACIFPVALSLIADYFSAKRAPRALSIFVLGTQLGGGFSLLAGGAILSSAASLAALFPLLGALQPWQIAFIVVGLPGLLYALLILTFREPARVRSIALETEDRDLTVRETAAALWERRSFYIRIYLGVGSVGVVQLGIPSWMPAFLMRVHGMSPADTGFRMGLLSIVVGTCATLLGPIVAARVAKRGYVDAHIRTAAFSTIGMFLCCALIPLVPGPGPVMVVVAGAIFFNSFPIGLMAYTLQSATPSRIRGVAASLYTFAAQLIGYAIGPTVTALITDRVFGNPNMVGHSLQIVTCVASVSACLVFFTILRPYRHLIGHEGPARQRAPAATTAQAALQK